MISKKNKVNRKQIDQIFKEGKFFNSENLTFKFTETHDSEKRISFVAPKSVAKLAVKRNLLRRRGYVALEKYFNQFPSGLLGVFIFKKYQDDVLILENEIKYILNKIN